MLLIRPDRKDRGRIAVFLAVIALHLVAALLLLSGSEVYVPVLPPEQGVTLTFLPAATPRLPQALPRSHPLANSSRARTQEANLDAAPTPPEPRHAPEPNNAITLPYRDWDAEAQAEARRQGAREETERERRNLAGPSASQLDWWRHNAPLARDHHEPGDTEYAAGEVITWLNDRCFYTTNGITTFGMPQTSKVCKDPPKPETHLFEGLRKQLDERKSGRTP